MIKLLLWGVAVCGVMCTVSRARARVVLVTMLMYVLLNLKSQKALFVAMEQPPSPKRAKLESKDDQSVRLALLKLYSSKLTYKLIIMF